MASVLSRFATFLVSPISSMFLSIHCSAESLWMWRDGGNPYEFGICASIRGQFMLVEGLSMGEMVTINREIARAIREAKHARSL